MVHRVSPILQKHLYPLLTRLSSFFAGDVLLLCYGYEEDPPMAVPLTNSDEPERFPIQLYHRTATQADGLSGKRVLEIGCGHGGGASYLVRTMHPASYTGLDLNPAAIAFCQKRHNLFGLDFVQGDAENLPFPDQSFDAVINIESSHCYPHFPRFLAEVARVLRPGGHFLYADARLSSDIADLDAALANAPMQMLSRRTISAEIVRGSEKLLQHLPGRPTNHTSAFLHRLYRRSISRNITRFCRELQSGAISYSMYCAAME